MKFLSEIQRDILLIMAMISLFFLLMHVKSVKEDIKRIEKDMEYLNKTFIKMAFE